MRVMSIEADIISESWKILENWFDGKEKWHIGNAVRKEVEKIGVLCQSELAFKTKKKYATAVLPSPSPENA